MTEVFVEFDTSVRGENGKHWLPRVCGRVGDDGLWEGWIEFTPANDADEPVRTSRETQQPNRNDLMYWAQGLTQGYLEQALRRALQPHHVRMRRDATSYPHFDQPAPRRPTPTSLQSVPRPVLNPFDVYQQGEDILVRELSALDVSRVREIAVGYGFLTSANAEASSRERLVTSIVSGVRGGLPAGGPSDSRAGD
jgi:hypothetical protein